MKAGVSSICPLVRCTWCRGALHNPVADDECWVVPIEPVQTKHTGDVESPLTRTIDEQLGGVR
ncbi:hypothetical protein EMIT0111MI5_80218 [Burkholderia sp. IT-111MI5]